MSFKVFLIMICLLLGTVNTIFDNMLKEDEDLLMKWAKDSGVDREYVHGGRQSFAGNACNGLLKNIDVLESYGIKFNCGLLKYVKCLRDFKNVVESCFSLGLGDKCLEYCTNFKKSYMELEISVTPKVHAVFYHVPYFCQKFKKGLGFFSEQAMESVHADFKKTWQNYKIAETNKHYPERLLQAVQKYNSLHI